VRPAPSRLGDALERIIDRSFQRGAEFGDVECERGKRPKLDTRRRSAEDFLGDFEPSGDCDSDVAAQDQRDGDSLERRNWNSTASSAASQRQQMTCFAGENVVERLFADAEGGGSGVC
jgi:hypothetical protein